MELVFATHNVNKVVEVQGLMPKGIKLLSLKDIGCTEDIPETAQTLEGNALLKAQFVLDNYGYSCFADDTGLEVAALSGAPGVFSARYAGPEKSNEKNMQRLLVNLKDKTDRSAQFRTVIAFVSRKCTKTFEGICKGEITKEKSGTEGFGYDPIFMPKGFDQTFAQMPLSLKNKIGHRGKAVQLFLDFTEKLL